MANLKGSKTAQNLKDAFAGESQANRRYLYFAQKADVEGYNDVSAVFRSTAEGETGHAHGPLEYLKIEIAAIGLAFAGERCLQIVLGFRTFQRCHPSLHPFSGRAAALANRASPMPT